MKSSDRNVVDMSNYTEDDLVRIRSIYSSKEILEYFDLDEEDKEYLKKIDECLQLILDINFMYGYHIPEQYLVDTVLKTITGVNKNDHR